MHSEIVVVLVLTCVAVYAIEALVTQVMPCIHAFPDHVALQSFLSELGEVNICLKALVHMSDSYKKVDPERKQTQISMWLRNNPCHGFSTLYP